METQNENTFDMRVLLYVVSVLPSKGSAGLTGPVKNNAKPCCDSSQTESRARKLTSLRITLKTPILSHAQMGIRYKLNRQVNRGHRYFCTIEKPIS